MKRNVKLAAERLRSVLLTDKIVQPEKFKELLKAEVYSALENYFELRPETLDLKLLIIDNTIGVKIEVKADRIKPYGNFVTENM